MVINERWLIFTNIQVKGFSMPFYRLLKSVRGQMR